MAALAVVLVALLAPAGASAHAYLVRTVPAASGILDSAPQTVSLTFDEAVEPRFAIVSVTDASGTQHATAAVQRSPANPDTLVVPVNRLPEGWYLVYWRAISVDGHPVQGAFTFAVGPNPGPAPQFPVPRVSATAVTAQLLIARWVMFASIMSAIGLLVLRLLIARAVIRRVPGTTLRVLTRATIVAGGIGLIAIPVYLDFAIANDSLRSVFDLGALVPLFRVTAFGRGYLDLELCFALFCVAGGVALWVDRPDREQRSIAELAAITGALLAAVAVLIIPGAVGHAGQTPPRGLSMFLDAVHLMSGSVWLGGLIGLLVLWLSLRGGRPRGAPSRVSVLAVVVPRFSSVAFVSVLVLLATGTGATIIHMPAVNALWDTSYGQAILVKILLLLLALGLAAGNLLRTKPGLAAARRAHRARRVRYTAPQPTRERRDDPRRRRRVRGRPALQPRAAAAVVRASELGSREGRSGAGRADGAAARLHAAGARLTEQGRRAGLVRTADHEGWPAGPRRHRHPGVQSPGDGDAPAGIPAQRGLTGRLLPVRPGARDGRPVGPLVPDNSARWRSLHRAHRRPGERLMDARQIGLRLLASLIALGCGIAALVVAILLVRGVVA